MPEYLKEIDNASGQKVKGYDDLGEEAKLVLRKWIDENEQAMAGDEKGY